jgi:drug/metabolite transporter (DMT)-like permease
MPGLLMKAVDSCPAGAASRIGAGGKAVWPVLLGTGAALGLGMPLAKAAALSGVSSIAFALWPTAMAALLLALVAARRHGRLALNAERIRFAVIAALLGHALPMTAVFWLSAKAGAGFASLAFTMPPVFTLIVALLIRLERFSVLRALAVAVGLCGALLLVAGSGRLGGGRLSLAALLLVLAIPALVGSGNVYRAVRTPSGLQGEWMASLILGASFCVLLPVGLAAGQAATPLTVPAFGWLGAQVLALVVGYILYFELQRRAEPVTFSFMGYVMTLTGVVVGGFAFGERLPWVIAPAVLLIMASLWLIQRAKRIEPASHGTGQRLPPPPPPSSPQ